MQLIPQINAQVNIIDLTVRDIGIEKVLQKQTFQLRSSSRDVTLSFSWNKSS